MRHSPLRTWQLTLLGGFLSSQNVPQLRPTWVGHAPGLRVGRVRRVARERAADRRSSSQKLPARTLLTECGHIMALLIATDGSSPLVGGGVGVPRVAFGLLAQPPTLIAPPPPPIGGAMSPGPLWVRHHRADGRLLPGTAARGGATCWPRRRAAYSGCDDVIVVRGQRLCDMIAAWGC